MEIRWAAASSIRRHTTGRTGVGVGLSASPPLSARSPPGDRCGGRHRGREHTPKLSGAGDCSPPTFYVPPDDVHIELLELVPGGSHCEWKGDATYWTVTAHDEPRDRAAWSYEDPLPAFVEIRGFFSFYPALLECYVDRVRVQPQPGQFYGGWMTPELVGPVKGDPGSEHW